MDQIGEEEQVSRTSTSSPCKNNQRSRASFARWHYKGAIQRTKHFQFFDHHGMPYGIAQMGASALRRSSFVGWWGSAHNVRSSPKGERSHLKRGAQYRLKRTSTELVDAWLRLGQQLHLIGLKVLHIGRFHLSNYWRNSYLYSFPYISSGYPHVSPLWLYYNEQLCNIFAPKNISCFPPAVLTLPHPQEIVQVGMKIQNT